MTLFQALGREIFAHGPSSRHCFDRHNHRFCTQFVRRVSVKFLKLAFKNLSDAIDVFYINLLQYNKYQVFLKNFLCVHKRYQAYTDEAYFTSKKLFLFFFSFLNIQIQSGMWATSTSHHSGCNGDSAALAFRVCRRSCGYCRKDLYKEEDKDNYRCILKTAKVNITTTLEPLFSIITEPDMDQNF